MNDTTHPPDTTDGACVDCGQTISLCDHACQRLLDPERSYWLGVEEELRAVLATAEREWDAYRAQVSEELAARELEREATTRLAASHHEWVDRATRAESRARALREALEPMTVWLEDDEPTCSKGNPNLSMNEPCDHCAVAAMVKSARAALAAASDGPGAADWHNAPSVNLLTGMLPSVEPAAEDEVLTFPDAATAISWLQSDDDGPGAAPLPWHVCGLWGWNPGMGAYKDGHHPLCGANQRGPGAAPVASTFVPSGAERRDGYDPDQQLARRIDAWLDDLVLSGSLAASERRRLELKIGPGAAPSGEA